MVERLDDALRAQLFGEQSGALTMRAQTLRGGLEAQLVQLVTATLTDVAGERRVARFVRKVATGAGTREVEVYAQLVALRVPDLAPRLLHANRSSATSIALFLEALPKRRWPWRDVDASAAVLERVAALHAMTPSISFPAWDYERELAQAASSTVEIARRTETAAHVRGMMPMLERVVEALPRMRRILCTTAPFAGLIHGDLHPGNVLHRRRRRRHQPVLVDWARARHGSALEDVGSWLQSLGAWEPEARRRHDTLFVRYLAARGFTPRLTSELRDLYWLACASNALAGALAYYLAVAAQSPTVAALRCIRGWLRVLRRADERLR